MELKEQELLDLINSGEAFVLKVFMDNCPNCTDFEPIFERVAQANPQVKFVSFNLPRKSAGASEFKKKYMVANGKERIAAPATMLFAEKELKARQYGKMSEQDLVTFISTGKSKDDVKNDLRLELNKLFSAKGEILTLTESLPAINKRIVEIKQLLQS